jgi:hypothetical protein
MHPIRLYINLVEAPRQLFVHYSETELAKGAVLTPRPGTWWRGEWATVLERYRPADKIPLSKAVFMFDGYERHSKMNVGGGDRHWRFDVKPLGPVERHDARWAFDLDAELDSDGDEDIIRNYARNYWNGVASEDEMWEYVTTSAKIIRVERV